MDLRRAFPNIQSDAGISDNIGHRNLGSANTIQKLLHMLIFLSEMDTWVCRLERDTYFLPHNFRRLVHDVSLEEAHYIGVRSFQEIDEHRVVYNDGGPGICLTPPALRKLANVLMGDLRKSDCYIPLGHREDYMLGVCLRKAGVYAANWTTDPQGREYFSIRSLRRLQDGFQPPKLPLIAEVSTDPPTCRENCHPWDTFYDELQQAVNDHVAERQENVMHHWIHRKLIYLPCMKKNARWVVDRPVSFNSFKNVSDFYEAKRLLRTGNISKDLFFEE